IIIYKGISIFEIADGYVKEKSRCTYSFPSIMSKNILQRRLGRGFLLIVPTSGKKVVKTCGIFTRYKSED
ncbi:hypothetical protein P4307_32350, partial [Brevibacillus porteri]|uniref:hypothetical protein n=1 Tax=Brevibacillus porteri TaxID=2126350 RepID=UPI002E1CEC3B|nr:hypothetical protein [Brevibacillus porteri]